MNNEICLEEIKSHWSYADSFQGGEQELIKSFVHYDYSIGFHTHSFYELNIVLSGTGKHFIEQMSCEARRGCVFVIPPNVKHGYVNFGNLNVYHMLIHGDFFNSHLNEFTNTIGFSLLFDIEPYLRTQYTENLFLILSQEELRFVLQDIDIINSCEPLTEYDIYINAVAKKIIAFLCMLIEKRFGGEQFRTQTSKELLSITNCLNFIHQNYGEKLSIESLAGMLNMSRSTFIRHFTKICGCSPHQYIKSYRLKKAKEFFENPKISITEIAQQCGFYDLSHFKKCLNAEK